MKNKMEVDETVNEKLVMKDYNPNQRNLREDGEIGEPEDQNDRDEHHHGGGIPCQTQ